MAQNLLVLGIFLVITCTQAKFDLGKYSRTISGCCREGANWGQRYQSCKTVRVSTTYDKVYEQSCKIASTECCKREVSDLQCKKGQTSARYFQPCNLYETTADQQKEQSCSTVIEKTCCNCCWIGLRMYDSALRNPQLCTQHANTMFGGHCKDSFMTCCKNGAQSGMGKSWKHVEDIQAIATAAHLKRIKCKQGYQRDTESGICKDVNECAYNPCSTGYACVNTEGSYICQRVITCGTGYYLASNNTCLDIDECEAGNNRCPTRTKCVNRPGSFRCVPLECASGYEGDAAGNCRDIDECAKGTDKCPKSATCVNGDGSYTCKCNTGFRYLSHRNQCRDINECARNLDDCKMTQKCVNLLGSFKCVDAKKRCRKGFAPDKYNRRCNDINECADANLNNCQADERCINIEGDFTCERQISCQIGTSLNSLSNVCEDIDECRRRTAGCQNGQRCINTFGSYSCMTDSCPTGFMHRDQDAQDYTCVDIDECSGIVNPCGEVGVCRNFQGSYTCHCKVGYEFDQTDGTCVDIDECSRGLDSCNYKCQNIVGGFECSCPPGFLIDKQYKNKCKDIDECDAKHTPKVCTAETDSCFNTFGSHQCLNLQCPDGFNMDTLRNGIACHRDCIYIGANNKDNNDCSDISAIYYPSKPINAIPTMGHFKNITDNGKHLMMFAFSSGVAYNQNSESVIVPFEQGNTQDENVQRTLITDYKAHSITFYDPSSDNKFVHTQRGRYEFLALQKQLEGPHLYAVKVKTTVSGRKWFEGQFYSLEEQQLRYVLIFTSQYEF